LTVKPAHLGPFYASQFQDSSVVAAYRYRPPFPIEVFDVLESLHAHRPTRVLELGCGTGDLTLGLLQRADRIDAIEPSAAMLAAARERIGLDAANVRWVPTRAEEAQLEGPYTLAAGAESLHWMDWAAVLPKVAASLADGAFLALVERATAATAWDGELRELVQTFSTSQDYRPCDLVAELADRGLFRESGRRTTASSPFVQSIENHVESMHSRNGFSRDRMAADAATEFDRLYRELLERHSPGGMVTLAVSATVVWGVPLAT
jgi:trans-aconitate methyltransferase